MIPTHLRRSRPLRDGRAFHAAELSEGSEASTAERVPCVDVHGGDWLVIATPVAGQRYVLQRARTRADAEERRALYATQLEDVHSVTVEHSVVDEHGNY